jgi:glutamate--cysteine ligase
MLVRRRSGPWTAPAGVTFRTWLQLGRAVIADRPPPTVDDLAYHLSTLFPQVRPRGHLEIRYIDAQPGNWWTVPTAVIGALLDDSSAAITAREACASTEGRWRDAARVGLDDPTFAGAATAVLAAAATALRRAPEHTGFADQVEEYLERWTARGRCPADDPPEALTAAAVFNNTDPVGDDPS